MVLVVLGWWCLGGDSLGGGRLGGGCCGSGVGLCGSLGFDSFFVVVAKSI